MSLRFKLPDGIHVPASLPSANWPKRRPKVQLNSCLNCGEALTGKFCSNCGQEAVDHRTAVWPLISDALGEFLRWDSKIVHTVVPLLFRPGFLTNEYNAGKRVKYLSPFRMYLTVSVIFFLLVFSRPSSMIQINSSTTSTPGVSASFHAGRTVAQLKQVSSDIDVAKKQLPPGIAQVALPGLNAASTAVNQAAIQTKQTQERESAKKQVVDPYGSIPKLWGNHTKGSINIAGDTVDFSQLPSTYAEYQELQADPKYPFKNRPFVQRLIQHLYKNAGSPELIKESLENMIPKAAFLMLPLFALVLYAFYWRARRYYVEHLVFALHNHTFVFILTSVNIFMPDAIATILTIGLFTYLYISMLVVYKQHWFKTLLKYWAIGAIYSIMLLIGFLLTLLAAIFWP